MKVAVTTLAFCVAALLALGLVMIYSASTGLVNARTHTEVGAHLLQMQLIWVALGSIACAVMAVLDYALLKKLAWPVFAGALVLAACVFVPHFGMKLNGAHRWIRLPGATFQPSELVKIALIIMLAWYCDRSQRKMDTFKRGIILPGIIIAAALGLIFVEPDRGTTILLAAVSGMMLLVAGVRLKHLVVPALGGAAALAVSILHDPMRMNRIAAWLHPQQHLHGAALQAQQGMIAIGSGGVTGLGLGNGLQKLGYVPEIQSDFIFANIGEELGLIATLLVVLAFLLITICGFCIALNCARQFRLPARVGRHLFDFVAGRHQHRRRHQRPAEQGTCAAVHQFRRLKPARDAGRRRHFVERRASGAGAGKPARENISEPAIGAGDNPFAARAT